MEIPFVPRSLKRSHEIIFSFLVIGTVFSSVYSQTCPNNCNRKGICLTDGLVTALTDTSIVLIADTYMSHWCRFCRQSPVAATAHAQTECSNAGLASHTVYANAKTVSGKRIQRLACPQNDERACLTLRQVGINHGPMS